MLWQIPLFLVSTLVFLLISLLLAEAAWSPLNASVKTRLQLAVKRVARSQAEITQRSERCLLLFSLTCGLLTIAFLPGYITNMWSIRSEPVEATGLVTCRYAPMMYLGLFILLQAAGHISLAVTERQRHPLSGLLLNGYFWLPLLLSFASVAAYLPVHAEQATSGATSTVWLLLIQPVGMLALFLSLTGPVILVNTQVPKPVRPVQHWIRELHLFNTVFVMSIIVLSLTCFGPREEMSVLQIIMRFGLFPALPLVLVGVHYRLIRFLKRRPGYDPEALWKLLLWLSLVAVSASFVAFHVLGMSDHYMHLLLNFSLLAIWWGFVLPRFPFPASTNAHAEVQAAGEVQS